MAESHIVKNLAELALGFTPIARISGANSWDQQTYNRACRKCWHAYIGIPPPKIKSGALATPKTPENRGNTESQSASDNLNSTSPSFRKIKTPATASTPSSTSN